MSLLYQYISLFYNFNKCKIRQRQLGRYYKLIGKNAPAKTPPPFTKEIYQHNIHNLNVPFSTCKVLPHTDPSEGFIKKHNLFWSFLEKIICDNRPNIETMKKKNNFHFSFFILILRILMEVAEWNIGRSNVLEENKFYYFRISKY